MREASKACFFEKKQQKTFAWLSPVFPEPRDSGVKSFLLLFFKKAGLAFFGAEERG